ncbi:MAG: hypothetical protein GXY43_04495 [Clostridiaceae bacterium]|nr:hypothetical protein [Clostridiaceae bacterium]
MSTQNNYPARSETVSIGDWIITFILSGLPVIGFIMLIVWAFGSDAPQSKKNWARASLILGLIGFAIVILLYVFVFAAMIASGAFEDVF